MASLKLKQRALDKAQKWKPHKYQRGAVEFLLANGAAGLFLDPGLGKTSISLKAIQALKAAGVFRAALVIAPLRVCYQVWPAEQAKWEDFNDLDVTILHGSAKDKRAREKHDLYLINPEGLQWLFKSGAFKQINPDVLVLDESSKFKHSNTQRFKLLKKYLRYFARRWILTGSPAPNGLLDLFGQIYILDMGQALGEYITKYRERYFTPTGFGGYTWRLKRGADKLIHEAIRPLVLSLSAEDYLDMPELIDNPLRIDLPEKVRRIYDEMEKELIAFLSKEEVVTAASAGAAISKCAQIANGGLYKTVLPGEPVPNPRWVHLHEEKTQTVLDLLEELSGQPLLIAYDFEHDLDRLRTALTKMFPATKQDFPYIGGGVPPKRAKLLEDRWNDGLLPYLLGHPASMAHGINPQYGGFHVCWHSMTYDYELFDQFIRRLRRQGQKSDKVYNHMIIARKTVDEPKLAAVRGKHRTQRGLFDALKEYVEDTIA